MAVDQQPSGTDLTVAASATRRVAGTDAARVGRDQGPAITNEVPMGMPKGSSMGHRDPDQPTVAHAGHVDQHATAHVRKPFV